LDENISEFLSTKKQKVDNKSVDLLSSNSGVSKSDSISDDEKDGTGTGGFNQPALLADFVNKQQGLGSTSSKM
jgi:hypothetical protein